MLPAANRGVVSSVDFLVTRVDPKSNSVAAKNQGRRQSNAVAVLGDRSGLQPVFQAADPDRPDFKHAAPVKIDLPIRTLAFGKGSGWLVTSRTAWFRGSIRPREPSTASFKAAREINGLAYGDGLLWVSSTREKRSGRSTPSRARFRLPSRSRGPLRHRLRSLSFVSVAGESTSRLEQHSCSLGGPGTT